MNPNDLKFIPNMITAESFLSLRRAILKETQNSGLKHNRWHIEEVVDPDTGEPLRYNYYFESEIEEYEIQKTQLKIEGGENAN